MLKFIFMMLFMAPLCFLNGISWLLVQVMFFILTFMFMLEVGFMGGFDCLGYSLGVDLLSYGLLILSFWIVSLMVLSSVSVFRSGYYSSLFLLVLLFMMLMLFCTFSSLNMISFYVFFESSLIPTLLLILGWGYQPERVQAGFYLLFYTLFASLPLLIGLLMFYDQSGMLGLWFCEGGEISDFYFYLCMMVAFLVSMPMFMVHLWLPKAHVEAPVSGSMILAGVLLKLGGYGLLRLFSVMVLCCVSFNYLWVSVSLVGGFLVSLICLRQMDMSALIAYSSVAHMGIALAGLMTLNVWGFCGAYLMMVGHGLCSSGLFCLANVVYERLGSRSMLINSGLLGLMPSLSLWWFLLSSSNMAAPPSLNLLAEISLINSVLSWGVLSMLLIMLLSFFSAAYSLYMYSYSQHGSSYSGGYCYVGGVYREFHMLFLHWFPLNVLIVKSDLFFTWL